MRKIYYCLIATIALLMMTTNAFGGDGNELLDSCQTAELFMNDKDRVVNLTDYGNARNCLAEVYGVTATAGAYSTLLEKNHIYKICLPSNWTTGQIVRVLLKYLRTHPEKLHQDSNFLIRHALLNAYHVDKQLCSQCPNSPPDKTGQEICRV